MKYSIKLLAAAALSAITATTTGNAVVIDFESPTSYDNNTTSQTFGSFRDLYNNSYINRVTEGSNSFLRWTNSQAGATAYDTTPATNSPDSFSVGIGQTLTVAFNLQATTLQTSGTWVDNFDLGIFTTGSSGNNVGVASRITLDALSTANTTTRLYGVTGFDGNGAPTYQQISGQSLNTLSATASMYRVQYDFTNLSLTQGEIKLTLYSLTELDGSAGAIADTWTYTFNYGTGNNQINIDPSNISLFFRSAAATGVVVNFDNLALVVPEPSVGLLLLVSLVVLGFRLLPRNRKA